MGLHRDIDLLDIIKLLRQRMLLIICMIVVAMTSATILVMRLPRMYMAQATIVMNSRSNKIADLQSLISKPLLGVPAADTSVLRTEMETISSPSLIRLVVLEQGLLRVPEFNPTLSHKPVGLSAALKTIPLVQRLFAHVEGVIAVVKSRAGPVANTRMAIPPADPLSLTIARVQNALSVTNDGVSYVLTIQFRSHDPYLAATVANAFAQIYLREQEKQKLATTLEAAKWLGGRIRVLEGEVLKSEREFLNFRARHGLVEEGGSKLIDRQIAQVSTLLTAASAERAKAEAALGELRQLGNTPGGIDGADAVVESPLIQALRLEQVRLQDHLAALSAHLLPHHPSIRNGRATLREIQGRIAAEITKIAASRKSEVEAAEKSEGSLRVQLAALQKQRADMTGAEVQLRALERVANANRALYVSYLEKYKEIAPQEHSQEPDARLLAAAAVPLTPSSPNRVMLVAAALIASTGFAVTVALLLGWARSGLYGFEGLEAFGPVRDFGFIPEMGRHARPVELPISDPASMFPEAVQRVYAELQCIAAPDRRGVGDRLWAGNGQPEHAGRVVLVTSALPGEGKSVLAASLARSIALAGRRVLLLDCDLRRPSIARLFGSPAAGELSEFIVNPNGLSEMVAIDPASGLHYVGIRKERRRVHAVLNSPQLTLVLNDARARYDYVILDTPPLLPVCDALLLSKLSDMMLLVVRWERTPRVVVGHVLRALRENKVAMTGVLLTRVNMRKHARNNYGGSAHFQAKYAGYYR